jgi:hypothetical protein
MGMLQTMIRKIPEGKTSNEFIRKINSELENHFEEWDNSCESYNVGLLKESNFDSIWDVQETYKNTPEIREKYRNLAKEGKLVYIEIDY